MASKLVIDRQRSGGSVVALGNEQAATIGASLKDALGAYLKKGEKLPDSELLVTLLARRLDDLTGKMAVADAAHDAELRDDAEPRNAREASVSALYDKLVDTREMVIGVYGSAFAASIGLTGTTPRDAIKLSRFSKDIENACQTAKVPKARVKGASLHMTDLASDLATLRAPLDAAVADVVREEREAQTTLAAKNQALAAYDAGFQATATLFEGLLLAAARADLAAKVRPSVRRPGQTQEAAGEEPTAPAEPAAPTT